VTLRDERLQKNASPSRPFLFLGLAGWLDRICVNCAPRSVKMLEKWLLQTMIKVPESDMLIILEDKIFDSVDCSNFQPSVNTYYFPRSNSMHPIASFFSLSLKVSLSNLVEILDYVHVGIIAFLYADCVWYYMRRHPAPYDEKHSLEGSDK
jgi:hypothetical protein